MKHCPECHFNFPDFHRVCDFDGTELVTDESRALVRVKPPRPSLFRRVLTSPGLLTSLAMVAVFSSAVLIGYHESATDIPPVVKDQPAPPSLSVARTSEQSSDRIKTPVTAKRGTRNLNTSRGSSSASLRRQVTAPQSLARLNKKTSIGDRSVSEPRADRGPRAGIPRGVVDATGSRRDNRDVRAGQPRPRQVSEEKDRKLVAILKTTWNVLKKPFKF